MTFEPIEVSLDENCISDFIRRYHFNEDDKKEILRVNKLISPRAHAQFHYYLEETLDEKAAVVVAVDRTTQKSAVGKRERKVLFGTRNGNIK